MCHPDDESRTAEAAEGSADKMRADFANWEPRCVFLFAEPSGLTSFHRIQKLLHLVPTTLNWTLMDRAPLKTWVHKDGKVALLGDACHPMLVRIVPRESDSVYLYQHNLSHIVHKVPPWQ